MDNIVLISQNVKLPSLDRLKPILDGESEITFVSTQFLFENERELIDGLFDVRCKYLTFSDLLTDNEREQCDKDAFNPEKQGQDVFAYYEDIKILKNKRIIDNLLKEGEFKNKIIVCDDLGIYKPAWVENGFVPVSCDYYHVSLVRIQNILIRIIKKLLFFIKPLLNARAYYKKQISVAYKNDIKYLFYGSLNRIGYRIDLDFKPATKIENIKYVLNKWGVVWKNKTIRLSSFHEGYHTIPDKAYLNVKLIQDGYLPPNYSSRYFYFYGKHTEFYTWDKIGCNTFIYHHLPHRIMPIRKNYYIPAPVYPKKVRKILCVASGAGDWTAIKNRSDEDIMIWVFGKIAKMNPDIEIIYRCHPVWIHPLHQGVNSINRAAEYISWLNLPNFKLSGHIPNAIQDGKFCLSYKRSSFEEDLNGVDIVFGEHSIAMIDAAFKSILFSSCNVTGHRNYFEDITRLGFPHCESVGDIQSLINRIGSDEFKLEYDKAVNNYNQMTDSAE
jgi:hypothetical protein